MRDAFRVDLPLRRLFDEPTVAGLVEAISQHPGDRMRIEKIAQMLLRLAQLSDDEVETTYLKRLR